MKKNRLSNVRREILALLAARRKLIVGGLVLVFVSRASSLVLPGAMRYLVDDVVGRGREDLLLPLLMIVAAAVLVQAGASFALIQLLNNSAQKLVAETRIRLHQHIERLSLRYHDENKTGALVSRVMIDPEGLRNLVGTGLIEVVGAVFTAMFAMIAMFRMNVTLTMFAIAFLFFFAAMTKILLAKLRPMYRRRGAINAEVTGRLAESLNGIRVVKGFHAEGRESDEFAAGVGRLLENIKRSLLLQSAMSASSTFLVGTVSITIMAFGGFAMVRQSMTVGQFFSYTLYLGFLVGPALQVAFIGSQITDALAGLDRIREVFQEKREDMDEGRTRPIDRIQGKVRLDDVCFEYDAGKPVLRNVSLTAEPGSITALVGPSGSGKSTLVGLVAAFAKPSTGTVFVDEVDLSIVRLDSYRSQLGVVLQETFLFDGTLRQNILFGRPDASVEEVLRAAKIARVDEFAMRLEKEYETVIGERGVKLSGGQRQRVAIARAVLADPRILILDEATSSLDAESEALIQDSLVELMRGRTTFVIAHRLSTVRIADQIIVLEDGRIVELGSHTELLRLHGRYFDFYTRQAKVDANRFLNVGESADDAASTKHGPLLLPEARETPRNILGILQGD